MERSGTTPPTHIHYKHLWHASANSAIHKTVPFRLLSFPNYSVLRVEPNYLTMSWLRHVPLSHIYLVVAMLLLSHLSINTIYILILVHCITHAICLYLRQQVM